MTIQTIAEGKESLRKKKRMKRKKKAKQCGSFKVSKINTWSCFTYKIVNSVSTV